MPAVKFSDIEHGKLGICKLGKSSQELVKLLQLSEKENSDFQNIKYENRKREFLSVRLLLKQMLGEKNEIYYTANRKPRLTNSTFFISISHSSDLAAIIISEKNSGIDVENIHRNTEKVATRFLSEKEITDIQNSANPALQRIVYWSAKEAAFKFCDLPEVEFKSQIAIDSFALNSEGGIFTGYLTKKLPATKLAFHYFFHENNVIVYCVEEEKV